MLLQGFPRANIDIPAVRTARQRIRSGWWESDHTFCVVLDSLPMSSCGPSHTTVLSNDIKELDARQEEQLHALHAAIRAGDAGRSGLTEGGVTLEPKAVLSFAAVAAVTPGSPAALGGLQSGDELVRFGPICASNDGSLQALAAALPSMTGRAVAVVVRRASQKEEIVLHVSPGPWEGKGLLGATLQPL